MTSLDEEIARARSILRGVFEEYAPVATLAGFSGGHDSLVSTHFALAEIPGARAFHANTGIGIEKTRRFVRETSADRGWRLLELAAEVRYEDLVLGKIKTYPGGFPSAPMHPGMYRRLKERSIHRAATESRAPFVSPNRGRRWVVVVTGVRGDESAIRAGYRQSIRLDKEHSILWVNPFYWSTYDHFKAYRQRYDLPVNPVCLTLGFSGECLCGAHADKGELLRIRMVEPETADYLEALQRRAEAAGFPWGYEEGPPRWFQDRKRGQAFFDWHQAACGKAAGPDYRPFCHNCEKVKPTPASV